MFSIALVALIFLVAGLIQGITGFGAGLVAMPLLLLFLEARTAVPLSMLNGLLITAFLCMQMRSHLDWRKILPLCLGSVPGIYVGAAFLQKADDALIRILLGLLLIIYGLYGILVRPEKPRALSGWWSYVAGFGSGTIGTAFATGGPPAVIYTTLTGWGKDTIKATLSGFFFVTGTWMAMAHAVTGLTTGVVLRYVAGSALAVLLGVWIGSLLYGSLGKREYLRLILLLLIIMGAVMISSVFRSSPS
jgi:uncharacterized protein